MHHLRVFSVGLAIFMFMPLAGLITYSYALNQTVTEPGYIKENLRTSGVYSALSLHIQSSFLQDDEGNEMPRPVQKAVAATITPAALQSVAEPVLDSVFSDIDNPDALIGTTINLAPIKKDFSLSLQNEATAYIKKLPVCSQHNIPDTTSLLSLNCRPPGTEARTTAIAATEQFMSDSSVPKDSIVLNDVIGNNDTTGSFVIQIGQVLRWTRLSVFICGALFALTCIAIVGLSSSIRGGVHRLTTLLLTSAIMFALTSGLFALALQRTNFGGAETLTLESALGSSMRLLGLELFTFTLYFAAGFGVIGIVLLIGLYVTEKKKPSHLPQSTPSATIHS